MSTIYYTNHYNGLSFPTKTTHIDDRRILVFPLLSRFLYSAFISISLFSDPSLDRLHGAAN